MKTTGKVSLTIVLFLFIQGFVQSQEFRSAVLWKQADSLAALGQPKSALAKVEDIYKHAIRNKNQAELVKAILYKIRLNSDFKEDFLITTITDLKAEISTAVEPGKQILQSVLAEVYWKYYQNNQYRFRDRTPVKDNTGDSITTWDLKTLSQTIYTTYALSLEHSDLLKKQPVTDFEVILDNQKNYPFRPTLYDFLAWRALDFYMAGQVQKNFSPDSATAYDFAARLFSDLANFHRTDKEPRALIDLELKRLAFLHEVSSSSNKDSIYITDLQTLETKYISSVWSTDISYAMADFLNRQGQGYRPLISEKYRMDILSAELKCKEAIKRFPESDGAKNCQTLLQAIQQPSVELTLPYGITPEKQTPVLLEFKNLKKLYFRILKLDPEEFSEKTNGMNREQLLAWMMPLPVVKNWELILPEQTDNQSHSLEIDLPKLASGFYLLLATPDKSGPGRQNLFTYVVFWSSQISYISQRNEQGGIDVYILERESGKPLNNAETEAWVKNYNYSIRKYELKKLGNFNADKDGFLSVPPVEPGARYSNIFLKIRNKNDVFYTENFYQYPVSHPKIIPQRITRFFTDRAIYQPGQPIYFKGILLLKTAEDYKILPDETIHVVFNDVNNQKIAEQSFTTNEFGSFNGYFTAPRGVLPGEMSISSISGSTSFRVEEYKRPSFEVIFKPVEGNFRLGEKITVTGYAKAYAGNFIANAQVRYRVVRTARFPWWMRGWYCPLPSSPEMEIAQGVVSTDNAGTFSLTFTATPDALLEKSILPVFNYEVSADVTDINGETQSAAESVSAGYRSLLIDINLPEKLNLATDSIFTITSTNLNGRHTPAAVSVEVFRLTPPGRSFKSRLWEQPDLWTMDRDAYYSLYPNDIYRDDNNPEKWEKELVFSTNFNTLNDSLLNFRDKKNILNGSGYYVIILQSMDPFGEKVTKKAYFTIYDPASKEIPVNSLCWFTPLTTSGKSGEKAGFLIGSSEENLRVIFEIRVHDSLFSREWMTINQEQKLIEVPILEAYRGNFSVQFISVKYNRAIQNKQLIIVPYADKNLDISLETFRNKLEPGQKEEWKIRIGGPEKKPVNAELLAGMYDASLDVFKKNSWVFDIYRRYFSSTPWETNNAFKPVSSSTCFQEQKSGEYKVRQYYQLNWFGLNYFGGHPYPLKRGMTDHLLMAETTTAMPSAKGGLENTPETPDSEMNSFTADGNKESGLPSQINSGSIRIRSDFRETAFFYPSLVTDSAGDIILKFTAPESLTRWKFLGLAYTRNLEIGNIEKELVTSKDLMVFPNAPRFIRQGDTLVFNTKVVNLSGKELDGTVVLSLLDPISLKPLDNLILNSPTQKFASWRAGELVGTPVEISWKIYIPYSPELTALQYRITAVAGNFSDGEEKIISVLTNRMMVTETLPLPVRGKGNFKFSFDKLLDSGKNKTTDQTLKNYKLTLEFTSNPAWYAVQALPSLNVKRYENADAIFNGFYANSIASFIANSNPKIRTVFEQWSTLTPSALLSNLEKNQDLKSAFLQETPWIAEAKTETDRKHNLGLYFDLNTLNSGLREDLARLKKLQSPNGAWPWFEGMPENRYITQNIITGLGRLLHLGIVDLEKDPALKEVVNKAILYLDGQINEDYELIRKDNKGKPDANHLGSTQIQYLYARSYYRNIPMKDAGSRAAIEYYQQQAMKYWIDQDKYLQGMIALALDRWGKTEIPKLITKSLSEKALHSDEMGMYWAQERGWYWYQSPIETQALMIEVFDEVTGDNKSVEDLKIWLLKQKQTQDWKTTRATAEAVYALLLRGSDLLADNPEVKITLGKEKIDSEKLSDTPREAGTGYFQYSWMGENIHPEMGEINVSKSSDGLAWGAVYWQYFENLDQITPAKTPLKLEKQLFVERNTPSGPVLEPIELTTSPPHQLTSLLHVGDLLKVRIILTVDREMEFVHMKDMRASAFEPLISPAGTNYRENESLSGYRYQDGLGYYQSASDQAMNFFFDVLPIGTYVFEYYLKVNAAGDYSNGITSIQCMYAPEFSAHSEGIRTMIKE